MAKIEQEVEKNVNVRDEEMDVTQNSNVKWFESATANVRKVESMTRVIDEQENSHLDAAILKKDQIIELAEDQNADYMATIAELDKQIAETRKQEQEVKEAIAEEKKKTKQRIGAHDQDIY